MLERVGRGAFSEVFNLDGERVLKAFFDIPQSGFPDAEGTIIPRVVFSAELTLFERIQDHDDLRAFLPGFSNVADPRWYNLESTESYSSGCGIVMERIPGKDMKFSELPSDLLSDVEKVVEDIQNRVGIDHPWDGSCFVPGSRAPFTLIDIATPASRLRLIDELMEQDGEITPNSFWYSPRQLLRLFDKCRIIVVSLL